MKQKQHHQVGLCHAVTLGFQPAELGAARVCGTQAALAGGLFRQPTTARTLDFHCFSSKPSASSCAFGFIKELGRV